MQRQVEFAERTPLIKGYPPYQLQRKVAPENKKSQQEVAQCQFRRIANSDDLGKIRLRSFA